jgi:siroheme synthase (precorrin-2 oxidase/ferrochelatase)
MKTDTQALISALRALAMIAADNHAANAAITEAADRLEELQSTIADIRSTLYGHGLTVSGWHLNGELEPIDNFFEENGWV